jgi:hypothetical protein
MCSKPCSLSSQASTFASRRETEVGCPDTARVHQDSCQFRLGREGSFVEGSFVEEESRGGVKQRSKAEEE